MAVTAAVPLTAAPASRQPAIKASRAAARERAFIYPVAAPQVARRVVQGAQRAIRKPVGEEVQVIEGDQRAERHRRVDGAAHRDPEHRAGAQLGQRRDVGPVRDVVPEARVSLAMAGDVQHLDVADRPLRDERLAEVGRDRLRLDLAPSSARAYVPVPVMIPTLTRAVSSVIRARARPPDRHGARQDPWRHLGGRD